MQFLNSLGYPIINLFCFPIGWLWIEVYVVSRFFRLSNLFIAAMLAVLQLPPTSVLCSSPHPPCKQVAVLKETSSWSEAGCCLILKVRMDMHWSFPLFLFSLVSCNLIFPYYDHPVVLLWTCRIYISPLFSCIILLFVSNSIFCN